MGGPHEPPSFLSPPSAIFLFHPRRSLPLGLSSGSRGGGTTSFLPSLPTPPFGSSSSSLSFFFKSWFFPSPLSSSSSILFQPSPPPKNSSQTRQGTAFPVIHHWNPSPDLAAATTHSLTPVIHARYAPAACPSHSSGAPATAWPHSYLVSPPILPEDQRTPQVSRTTLLCRNLDHHWLRLLRPSLFCRFWARLAQQRPDSAPTIILGSKTGARRSRLPVPAPTNCPNCLGLTPSCSLVRSPDARKASVALLLCLPAEHLLLQRKTKRGQSPLFLPLDEPR